MNITKGPWAVDEATHYVHSVENVENGKRMQLICDIVPHKAGRADNRPFTDEMLANARAIAEVPNLVGALRDFVTHYAGPLRGQLGNGYAYQWYDRAQAILKRIED